MKNILKKSALTLLAALSVTACSHKEKAETVKVGILHSQTGTMAHSEIPVSKAELMAIEEINEEGGVLGKKIEVIQEDGESTPLTFAEKAKKLLLEDKVATIFGCWTSDSRKAVKTVLENEDVFGLLWYPLQYEGLEASPNIMYIGAAPNQQVVPAIEYCVQNFGKKIYLIGSDYIFPRTVGRIANLKIKYEGAECVGETYVSMDCTDFSKVIQEIKEAKPDAILNSINGDSNKAFFKALKEAGITAEQIPVMSLSISESEVSYIGTDLIQGHYVAWNYLQSISTLHNMSFVSRYRKFCQDENAAIGDPMESAYIAVHLWAAACEKAGTFDVEEVRMAAKGLIYEGPEGTVYIDGENQHLFGKVRVGKIAPSGLIEEVWKTADAIKPDPYLSSYVWAHGL